MITLCEQCFPEWGKYEVYTIVPMTPCEQCGSLDERRKGGLGCHVFPRDPRKAATNEISSEVKQ